MRLKLYSALFRQKTLKLCDLKWCLDLIYLSSCGRKDKGTNLNKKLISLKLSTVLPSALSGAYLLVKTELVIHIRLKSGINYAKICVFS